MKIAFTGSHGVGKTTLLREIVPLLKTSENFTELGYFPDTKEWGPYFNYKVFDGVGRRVHSKYILWSDKQKQRYFNYWYAWRHYVHHNFVGSRSIFDTFAYSRLLVGLEYHRDLFNWARCHINYDYIFYVPIEFPLERDGVRYDDKGFQILHDRETKLILDYHHIPYHVIRGSTPQRLAQLRGILDV